MATAHDAYACGSHASSGAEFVAPVPFDYTLLSSLYVHREGGNVIDFSGDVAAGLHLNRSIVAPAKTATTTAAAGAAHTVARDPQGTYVSMQADTYPDEDDAAVRPRRTVSRLVRTENTVNHIWLVSQAARDDADGNANDEADDAAAGALFARTFYTPAELFAYCAEHHMLWPVRHHGTDMLRRLPAPPTRPAATTTAAAAAATATATTASQQQHHHYRQDSHMPTSKWIDIQCARGDPDSARLVRDVLSRFPLDEATLSRCVCLGTHDQVDTDYLSSDAGSYIYLQLMCTPHSSSGTSTTATTAAAAAPHAHEPIAGAHGARAKSVMQMRFEAVRDGLPRDAVPAAVPVAVLVFAEWIVTIHEQPFTEMNDLLRLIALRCSPQATTGAATTAANATGTMPTTSQTATVSMHARGGAALPQRHALPAPATRFTSSFVFASIMQIVIGHHLDSVTLARAVDDLGDVVFDVQRRAPQQDRVLRRITAVRRCFGECSADVNRRESIVAQLLQPQLAHNFLLKDAQTRQQLEQALTHLRYVLHELEDCRDAVAMSSWYHNIALHWTMLKSGNSALRQLLQMTEIANVVFPVFIIQTIYSMNVQLPYQYSDDPLFDSMVPFYLLAGIMAAYTIACLPALLRIFKRKRFATRLLA